MELVACLYKRSCRARAKVTVVQTGLRNDTRLEVVGGPA